MYYDITNNCKLPKSFEFPQTEQSFGFVCSVLVCFSLENLFKNVEMVIGSKNIEKKIKMLQQGIQKESSNILQTFT